MAGTVPAGRGLFRHPPASTDESHLKPGPAAAMLSGEPVGVCCLPVPDDQEDTHGRSKIVVSRADGRGHTA